MGFYWLSVGLDPEKKFAEMRLHEQADRTEITPPRQANCKLLKLFYLCAKSKLICPIAIA